MTSLPGPFVVRPNWGLGAAAGCPCWPQYGGTAPTRQVEWDLSWECRDNSKCVAAPGPPTKTSATVFQLLTLAGIAATSALSPLDPWALRYVPFYSHCFALDPKLLLDASVSEQSEEYRGHLSGELGEGLAWWVLFEHMDIIHICRVKHLMEPRSVAGHQVAPLVRPARGQPRQPDLYCLDAGGNVVLAEAKGRNDSPKGPKMRAAIDEGLLQVCNADPVGRNPRIGCGRVVIATALRDHGRSVRKGTTTRIVEPPCGPKRGASDGGGDADATRTPPEAVARLSYATMLRFAGRPDLAAAAMEARTLLDSHEHVRALPYDALLSVGRAPTGGTVSVVAGVLLALGQSGSQFMARYADGLGAFAHVADGLREALPEALVLRSGVVVTPDYPRLGDRA